MSKKQSDFQDRLQRIQKQVGETPEPPQFERATPPKRQNTGWLINVIIGILATLFITMSLYAFFMFKNLKVVSAMAQQETYSALHDQDLPEPTGSFLQRLFFGYKLGVTSDPRQTPMIFMPKPPKGWIRITALDAQRPNLLATLKAQWPKHYDGKTIELKDHTAYRRLTQFIRRSETPDLEQRVLSNKRAHAVYLHPDNSYLVAELAFLGASSALGTKKSPDTWVEALIPVENKKLQSKEILEKNRLGGIPVLNRTRPVGTSARTQPIGQALSHRVLMKISAPLSPRTVMRIEGFAPPLAVASMLRNMDRKAILARHR